MRAKPAGLQVFPVYTKLTEDSRIPSITWGEWKNWLETQHSKKLRSWHPVPSLHGKWTGKKWKQWQILFSWVPKSLWMVTTAMKLKGTYSLLGREASCCSVAQPCPTHCDPMEKQHTRPLCPLPPPEVCPSSCPLHRWCTQSSHPLTPSSLSALNPSQHQGLFQWVSSSYQRTKILELKLQHQSFQWVFRIDLP